MARENQGLQIALIAFVTLTIILSVTTYLGFKNYSDEFKAKETALQAGSKADLQNTVHQDHIKRLKKCIGAADTDQVDAIEATFQEDMKKYGVGYPEDSLFYHKILDKLCKTIDEKNADLAAEKARIPEVQDDYKKQLSQKEAQLAKFDAERKKANDDLAAEQEKFRGDRQRTNDDKSKLHEDLVASRKEAKESLDKANGDLVSANGVVKRLKERVTQQGEKIVGYESDKVGVPSGEITWVSQRNSAVWINLGSSDSLTRQVSFSVFPPDVTTMTDKGAKKAKIEVTQIRGPHLSECRVVDDDPNNPIVPGDKIFTALWNPGGKRHLALAGLMDIDGDGRSDLQTVLNLIKVNGGVVDAYINDAGKTVGQISINTSCLILGDAPTERSTSAQRDSFTQLQKDADELRLEKMQLAELLQRMGWKNTAPVIRYGRGINPKDFRAKPDGGVVRKSTGESSDPFKKRQPPKSAY